MSRLGDIALGFILGAGGVIATALAIEECENEKTTAPTSTIKEEENSSDEVLEESSVNETVKENSSSNSSIKFLLLV